MDQKLLLHKTTRLQIESAVSSDNIQALGLSGTNGSGKSFLAEEIARKTLNIPEIANHPQVLNIDCALNSGIDLVRDIKKFLDLRVASEAKFNRCVILKNIEYLSDEAQNALLKTIEEPPKGTFIVITCNSMKRLRPTVVSRVQWINVLPIDKVTLSDKYGSELSEREINRSFALSQGNIVSFLRSSGIIDDENSDFQSIELAKELVAMNKFDRMVQIEKILKNDEILVDRLLESIQQVLKAALHASIKSVNDKNTDAIMKKIELVNKSQSDLNCKVSEKLVLTNLFYNL